MQQIEQPHIHEGDTDEQQHLVLRQAIRLGSYDVQRSGEKQTGQLDRYMEKEVCLGQPQHRQSKDDQSIYIPSSANGDPHQLGFPPFPF